MYDAVMAWDELDAFLSRLRQFKDAYQASIAYINHKEWNSQLILKTYKEYNGDSSIIIPGICETIHDIELVSKRLNKHKSIKWYLKKGIKCVFPYGIVRIIGRRRKG